MSTVTAHPDCAGFALEGPEGRLGWVEETWLGEDDTPCAYAVHTADGRRALLDVEDVIATDLDACEIFVGAGATLRELSVPHLVGETAEWRLTGAVVAVVPSDHAHAPQSRAPMPVLRAAALGLAALATLVCVEIALAYGVAWLVTGHPY